MAKKIKMTAKLRKKAGNAVFTLLKPTYFADGVPLHELSTSLEDLGIIMIMEDNTEWSGMLCGADSNCLIRLAPASSIWTPDNREGMRGHGMKFYEAYDNAALVLTWYKCTSRKDGKYEVVGYIS